MRWLNEYADYTLLASNNNGVQLIADFNEKARMKAGLFIIIKTREIKPCDKPHYLFSQTQLPFLACLYLTLLSHQSLICRHSRGHLE